jgi:hypothetical protein
MKNKRRWDGQGMKHEWEISEIYKKIFYRRFEGKRPHVK